MGWSEADLTRISSATGWIRISGSARYLASPDDWSGIVEMDPTRNDDHAVAALQAWHARFGGGPWWDIGPIPGGYRCSIRWSDANGNDAGFDGGTLAQALCEALAWWGHGDRAEHLRVALPGPDSRN